MSYYYYDKLNNNLLKLTDKIEVLMPNSNTNDYLVIDEITYNKVAKEGYVYTYNAGINTLNLEINVDIRKDYLREKREPLLIAFDKYKTNVVYGIIEETNDEHELIKYWYQKILDLSEDYILNNNYIPSCIKYYL